MARAELACDALVRGVGESGAGSSLGAGGEILSACSEWLNKHGIRVAIPRIVNSDIPARARTTDRLMPKSDRSLRIEFEWYLRVIHPRNSGHRAQHWAASQQTRGES